jgi:hypothetical protein
MAKAGYYGLRITDEREEIIERLRRRLATSGRDVKTIHGMVTTSDIIDEAFKALEKELDRDDKKHK